DGLQGFPPRAHPVDRDRGGTLRLRAGDHREARQAPLPDLRGGHLVLRANLRGGEEDQLQGRAACDLLHPQVQPFPLSGGASSATSWWAAWRPASTSASSPCSRASSAFPTSPWRPRRSSSPPW